ncbi:CFT1 [[Candida] subhashii]|uniref:CFT1 n=1 Tax=[Candida] subhashii TaxID=561895 RepID=A0A8J5QSY5_9ASCO|nr:CFT1 [[Candida] subhashii]KAG7666054.1 CFT1 [[Candida] subhashii]
MDAYKEFIEPSRVGNCVGCNFMSTTTKNLIVGKGSLLQIFEVILLKQSTPSKPQYRLKLISQFKLHGTITDLKAIRTIENPHLDYLMVSTKYAKFSIIKWDHHLHTITTVSLHYYESSMQNSTYEKLAVSELLLEPTYNSCSCLRSKNLLCFLPFDVIDDEEDEDEDDEDEIEMDGEKSDILVNEEVPIARPRESLSFYDASFIIDAQTLDSSIETIVDMQFMYNYREPTVAILSSKSHSWAGILPKVKDNLQFSVMTLDLQTKTTISNYQDDTELALPLEDCCIVPIPNDHRVLMVLKSGEFYYINFELDGKTIKRVHIDIVEPKLYENVKLTYPGEVAVLDNDLLFFANENGNSPLVQVKYSDANQSHIKNENHANCVDEKEVEDEDEDEDDLYKEEEEEEEKLVLGKSQIEFVHHDELINNGPISSFTLSVYSPEKFKSNLPNPNYNEVSIIANAGTHSQSKLNIITPTIQPIIASSLTFSQVNRMWNLNQKYLITSDDINFKSEIFQIEKSFARLNSKHFINDELTINMHELNNGKFILQITPKQIVLYNNAFKKRLSLNDEIKDDEILSSILRDEFLMIFLASGDVMIFSINTYNESYSKIEIPKMLTDSIITTGYIANSHLLSAVSKNVNLLLNKGVKRRHSSVSGSTPASTPAAKVGHQTAASRPQGPKSKTFILVTGDNRIVAFNRFHNQKCYQLNDVDRFTDNLTLAFFDPNEAPPDPFIKQIILSELGDKYHKEEYLTILTIGGEVMMYKLYFDGENYMFRKEKDLTITGAPENAYPQGTMIERRLVYFPNLNGYTCIFLTGIIPYLILKPIHSIPRIFQFSKIPAVSISAFSDSKIKNGLIFLDNSKNARICELSLDFIYEFDLPMRHILIGESIKSIAYHQASNTYILSTFKEIPYNCLDEDEKPISGLYPDKQPRATSYKGSIKLISPYNWTVIDSFDLDDNEIGMNIKSMILDVGSASKKFKNKKEFVVIGTGKYRMEDLSSNGSFKILEIIDIVPEPGRPETNHKFKEIFQEDTRGAITSICEVSGRFLVAQGQKVIVRDLQDDGVVPVAFLDTSVYVSETKSCGNLVLIADPLKSIWLVGFDAEPFRMIMLGKDLQHLNVNCADFICKDEEIYIVVADNNNVLHLIQYDPEDPQSLNGQRLLSKAAFETGSSISCLRSIPTCESDFESGEKKATPGDDTQIIGSTSDGSFFNVFPVDESTYRRMYILQQQLTDKEYHYCGLNPRLNRFGGAMKISVNETNAKPMLDYDLIRSYTKLNEDRKTNLASKVSSKNIYQDLWKDIFACEHSLEGM